MAGASKAAVRRQARKEDEDTSTLNNKTNGQENAPQPHKKHVRRSERRPPPYEVKSHVNVHKLTFGEVEYAKFMRQAGYPLRDASLGTVPRCYGGQITATSSSSSSGSSRTSSSKRRVADFPVGMSFVPKLEEHMSALRSKNGDINLVFGCKSELNTKIDNHTEPITAQLVVAPNANGKGVPIDNSKEYDARAGASSARKNSKRPKPLSLPQTPELIEDAGSVPSAPANSPVTPPIDEHAEISISLAVRECSTKQDSVKQTGKSVRTGINAPPSSPNSVIDENIADSFACTSEQKPNGIDAPTHTKPHRSRKRKDKVNAATNAHKGLKENENNAAPGNNGQEQMMDNVNGLSSRKSSGSRQPHRNPNAPVNSPKGPKGKRPQHPTPEDNQISGATNSSNDWNSENRRDSGIAWSTEQDLQPNWETAVVVGWEATQPSPWKNESGEPDFGIEPEDPNAADEDGAVARDVAESVLEDEDEGILRPSNERAHGERFIQQHSERRRKLQRKGRQIDIINETIGGDRRRAGCQNETQHVQVDSDWGIPEPRPNRNTVPVQQINPDIKTYQGPGGSWDIRQDMSVDPYTGRSSTNNAWQSFTPPSGLERIQLTVSTAPRPKPPSKPQPQPQRPRPHRNNENGSSQPTAYQRDKKGWKPKNPKFANDQKFGPSSAVIPTSRNTTPFPRVNHPKEFHGLKKLPYHLVEQILNECSINRVRTAAKMLPTLWFPMNYPNTGTKMSPVYAPDLETHHIRVTACFWYLNEFCSSRGIGPEYPYVQPTAIVHSFNENYPKPDEKNPGPRGPTGPANKAFFHLTDRMYWRNNIFWMSLDTLKKDTWPSSWKARWDVLPHVQWLVLSHSREMDNFYYACKILRCFSNLKGLIFDLRNDGEWRFGNFVEGAGRIDMKPGKCPPPMGRRYENCYPQIQRYDKWWEKEPLDEEEYLRQKIGDDEEAREPERRKLDKQFNKDQCDPNKLWRTLWATRDAPQTIVTALEEAGVNVGSQDPDLQHQGCEQDCGIKKKDHYLTEVNRRRKICIRDKIQRKAEFQGINTSTPDGACRVQQMQDDALREDQSPCYDTEKSEEADKLIEAEKATRAMRKGKIQPHTVLVGDCSPETLHRQLDETPAACRLLDCSIRNGADWWLGMQKARRFYLPYSMEEYWEETRREGGLEPVGCFGERDLEVAEGLYGPDGKKVGEIC